MKFKAKNLNTGEIIIIESENMNTVAEEAVAIFNSYDLIIEEIN
jgi:hypothetical protein